MHVAVLGYTHECKCPKGRWCEVPWGQRYSGWHVPELGAGNWTPALCKNSTISYPVTLPCHKSSIFDTTQKGDICLPPSTTHLFNCSVLMHLCHGCPGMFYICMGWWTWVKCLGMAALPLGYFVLLLKQAHHQRIQRALLQRPPRCWDPKRAPPYPNLFSIWCCPWPEPRLRPAPSLPIPSDISCICDRFSFFIIYMSS